jgi:hypothetical protein
MGPGGFAALGKKFRDKLLRLGGLVLDEVVRVILDAARHPDHFTPHTPGI